MSMVAHWRCWAGEGIYSRTWVHHSGKSMPCRLARQSIVNTKPDSSIRRSGFVMIVKQLRPPPAMHELAGRTFPKVLSSSFPDDKGPLLRSTAAKACKIAVFSPLNFSVQEIPANLHQFPAIPFKMTIRLTKNCTFAGILLISAWSRRNTVNSQDYFT